MASTISLPALADSLQRSYGFEKGEQAIAIMSRVLVDNDGDPQIIADDLVTTFSNLLGSAGAAAALSTLITGSDLTVSGTLTTLGTNIGAHDAQGVTLLAALLATTGSANVIGLNQTLVSPYTPVTTDTITASASKANETVYVTPAGTIAALTFTFPTNGNSRIGQVIRLVSHQIVTALTVSASGLTILGTAVTALAVDTPVSWQKVAASTWMRL